MAAPTLFLAVSPLEPVRRILLQDAGHIVLGILSAVAGLSAIGLFRLRTRTHDATSLWFGLFTTLYGLRLLADTYTVPFLLQIPSEFVRYSIAVITYIIPITGSLLVRELIPEWRSIIRWVLYGQVVFAVAGITADQITHQPFSLSIANNLLVV